MKQSIRVTNIVIVMDKTNGYKVIIEIFDTLGEVASKQSYEYAKAWCEFIGKKYSAKSINVGDGAHSTKAEFAFETGAERDAFINMLDCVAGFTMFN